MLWPRSELELIQFLSITMIFWAIVVYVILMHTNLKGAYGRYGSENWGFLIPARLAWVLQEAPAFLIPLIYIFRGDCDRIVHWENFLVLVLYVIHYTQRTLVYPCVIRGGKGSPILIVALAGFFCACNGYMQGRYHCLFAVYENGYATSLVSLAGIALFFAGFIINIHSDHVLRNLRKPGETGYKIPHGGIFEYISGGNFFGEIVEWIGYALYARTLPAVAFAIFTIANIGPRAWHHHQFYKEKFEDYPKNRKALIPFLL